MPERVVEVDAQRYPRWRERFEESNAQRAQDERQHVVAVERFEHDPLALLLVRRGGYGVGVAVGPELVAHKVGTRYVQSRTKKGGWSQQRYARRRGNQADELVDAAADHASRVLATLPEGTKGVRGLVLGGDRALLAQLLEDPRLRPLRELPRRELPDLPDPRLTVLQDALRRARHVRITIRDP